MLSQLFSSNNDNCFVIAKILLAHLKVAVTKISLLKDLQQHPDYPSLLSLSDVLTGYGVENISFKSSPDSLRKIPIPFIAQIKGENSQSKFFTLVDEIKDNSVHYYNPEKNYGEKINVENFIKKWQSGIVLIANAENAPGEKNYIQKLREEKRMEMSKYAAYIALPALVIIASVLAFINYGVSAIFPIIFSLITLLGCIVGSLLILYELDQYNPVLHQICSAGKKINCGAILNSKASKIAGISWSTIGFTYFAGGLFTLLCIGITNSTALFIVSWLNVFAVPYVFFSIYYQWRIAKQWCVLCLSVQGLLVLQMLTALIAGWHTIIPLTTVHTVNIIIPVILSYLIPFIIISLLLPAYHEVKESKHNNSELQRLRHNPQIFNALLAKQKVVTESTEGLGIILGNPNATNKIIKVCNPYCGPCARAHIPMEELLNNNPDVQIQIIFTATNKEGDVRASPVRHLLAIAENNSQEVVKKALDEWYLPEKKIYETFAVKYPMNGELKKQENKIDAMQSWCDKTGIYFTPTFFVNGFQLPEEIYNVNDLKYFLSV
jgi:uncharacterized membrane protein/thiol-disulfide isomerase/thioredoxin